MGKDNNEFKYYAISKGRRIGIYDNWSLAQKQVHMFSGSCYKGFQTEKGADSYMAKAGISKPKYIVTDLSFQSQQSDISCWSDTSFSKELSSEAETPLSSTPKTANKGEKITSKLNVQNEKKTTSSIKSQNMIEKTTTDSNPPLTDAGSSSLPNNTNPCSNCVNLTQLIGQLTHRLAAVESQLQKLNQHVTSNHCQDELFKRQKAFELQITGALNKLPTIDRQVSAGTHTHSSPRNYAAATSMPQATAIYQQRHRPAGVRATSPTPSTFRRTAGAVTFDPEKCVVITDINREIIVKLNNDKIREAISKKYGPIIIDLINRCKFQGPSPKYIIQLADTDTAKKIIDQWDSSLFGGSSARATIKPDAHVGVLKGVPIHLTDDVILADISKAHDSTKIYRLKTRNNEPLRTVKVTFNSEGDLDKALNEGILLDSLNMLFRIEKFNPYSHNG
jgi:hypothetical protein